MAYAAAVVALQPVGAVVGAAQRALSAQWSHALAGQLARRCVGVPATRRVANPEALVAEAANKFTDLVLELSVEVAEGALHLLVFGRLLAGLSPELLKWVLGTAALGTAASLAVGRSLPALFGGADAQAEADLVLH